MNVYFKDLSYRLGSVHHTRSARPVWCYSDESDPGLA
jgi:hypothetical protein